MSNTTTADPTPASLSAEAQPTRAITFKSLAFGLIGILIVAGGAGYHHAILGTNGVFMVSNHMPPIVFGYMMALALGWNGLVGRYRRHWALTPQELLVVMVMTLIACFPALMGLTRYALRIIMNPWYFLMGQPEWELHGLLEQISPALFPTPVPHRNAAGVLIVDERVYRGFFGGLSHGGRWVGLSAVPWSAWLPALSYWGPLVVSMSLAVTAMAFLVHRQWSDHEQLSYPVAQVASCFWKRRDNARGVPDIFLDRLFWFGFAPLFALYMLEYSNSWFPQFLPGLEDILPNLKRWWLPVFDRMPVLRKSPGSWYLTSQRISFAIVGLAYFVSAEISLTMGLSQFLLTLVGLAFFWSTGTPVTMDEVDNSRAGAYLGYTLILLYTGRNYFRSILGKALRFRRKCQDGDAMPVLAARVLVLSFAVFVAVLVLMGCDLPMALLYALTLMMLFLVFTRVICETGIPFLQAMWTPPGILAALFGPAAMGPRALTLLPWINSALAQDTRECLMPYVATSVRMGSDAKLPLKRIFWLIVGALGVALVVAFVSNLWVIYNVGSVQDTWGGNTIPKRVFTDIARSFGMLKTTGDYEMAASARGFARFGLIQADPAALRFFLGGIVLVVGCALVRFRFSRFPVHPVLFIAWGSWPAGISWAAYLMGWFIKTLVVRLGGGRAYQRLKPFFVGIIAAELIAVCVVILVDLSYYWITGKPSGIWTMIQAN